MNALQHRPARRPRPGFTLTELMVVMGILALVAAIGVPAYRTLTGSRSIEQATNTLSALLARTRNEAIGLQRHRALLFYIDGSSGRIGAAALVETEPPVKILRPSDVWFDLDDRADTVLLPPGIGLQTTLGGRTDASGNRLDNGYAGFNPAWTSPSYPHQHLPGSVIVFDRDGRLFVGTAGLVWRRTAPTALGGFLYGSGAVPGGLAGEPEGSGLLPAQLGFCLFDAEPFTGAFGTGAWQDDPAYGTAEQQKEQWLDANSRAFLVNRYNGTLIGGE